MHILSFLLFATSVNLDNLLVGIAYGVKGIRIHFFGNLLIAVITTVGTVVSMLAGAVLIHFLSTGLSTLLGSMILIALGVWMMKDFFWKGKVKEEDNAKTSANELLRDPEKADADCSGCIEGKETILLALALSLNNFGLGLGASIAGLNIMVTVGSSFLFSLLSLGLGVKLGRRYLSKFAGKYAALLSGLLIILLGVYELLV